MFSVLLKSSKPESSIYISSKNLLWIDSSLTLHKQKNVPEISLLCRSCYCCQKKIGELRKLQWRNLASIERESSRCEVGIAKHFAKRELEKRRVNKAAIREVASLL